MTDERMALVELLQKVSKRLSHCRQNWLRPLGTRGSQTHRWREPDSNNRSRSGERLFFALPIGGGTKGGATYGFKPETAMLAWSGSPQIFPLRRDLECAPDCFLQRRVCEFSVPEHRVRP